jgi:DNA-binding XRE family transcriptional regulator
VTIAIVICHLTYVNCYIMIGEEGIQEVHPLKLIRQALGLSQPDFAELLKVRPMTVSNWETGRRHVGWDLEQTAKVDLALASIGKRISDYVEKTETP